MPSRFEQLYELPENLYSDGSPVILSRGVLLKDSQTDSIIVQLKFQNVSTQIIKAVKVTVVPYDVSGSEIEGECDYQYLDLNVNPGESFGSKKAIIISNPVSRSFSVKSLTVIMEQGEGQDVSTPMESLPKYRALQDSLNNPELVKQYQLAVNKNAHYIPQKAFSIWQCSCGEWNIGAGCTHCGADKALVFSSLDISSLTDAMSTRLAEETAKEEERKAREQQLAGQQEREERRLQARNKKIGIGVVIGLVALAIILLVVLWVIPNARQNAKEDAYTEAQKLMDSGQYEEALAAFEKLGDYKDSNRYILDMGGTATGNCGKNVTWTLDNSGTLVIVGSGKMDDYESAKSFPWYSNRSDITSVIIKNGVISIEDAAFQGYASLTSVTIPSSVTTIGYMAFANCSSLTDVYYTGSESDWDSIDIDNGNIRITRAAIHFNSTELND